MYSTPLSTIWRKLATNPHVSKNQHENKKIKHQRKRKMSEISMPCNVAAVRFLISLTMYIPTNVVNSNPAEARCTRYNIM
jgi:hypothetical protein